MNPQKIRKNISLLSALVIFAFTTNCGSSRKVTYIPPLTDKSATILAVNDMHAAIDNFPRFAFMVDSLREIYPDMLLISGGDNQTGGPVNDQYKPKGYPMIALMNAVGFDFSVVGNHEFDTSQEGFATLIDSAHFDFICANAIPPQNSRIKLSPYKIITMPNGLKMAFTSVLDINNTGIPDSHPANVVGFKFDNPFETAKDLVHLKDSADILIYVNHFGFENDVELAEMLPPNKVDLIIGGHSHTKIDTEQIHNNILITQAERKLKYATLIELTQKANGTLERHMKLMDVGKKGNLNKEVLAIVDKFNDNPILNEKIATAEADLNSFQKVGYLMVDALRKGAKTDIALINPGGVRINLISKGDVTIKDIYSADPFGNEIVVYNLTGHELKNLYFSAFPMDEDIPMIPSGIKTTYHLTKDGKMADVDFFNPDGSPLDMDKTYRVSVNSFIASAYVFDKEDEGTTLFKGTAENMIDYLRELKIIPSYDNEDRISLLNQN